MLRIADKTFESHLFTGTGKFAAPEVMVQAIRASGSQLVTLAMWSKAETEPLRQGSNGLWLRKQDLRYAQALLGRDDCQWRN